MGGGGGEQWSLIFKLLAHFYMSSPIQYQVRRIYGEVMKLNTSLTTITLDTNG